MRDYRSFREAVRDVELARTLAGFHFQNSCLLGSNLGRTVGRYFADRYFQPIQGMALMSRTQAIANH